ncbi:MAG: AAC(3) family N-acetyltransferase [Candidatus Brocadiae bacterium]|nr:AAC(3) family N-acetyltransferase [Candidatus Brocadiia bacterium]
MELTEGDIERALRDLGLGLGDCVEVHSSLSTFGHVQGGAPTVVNALMNTVGEEGAIVMSAYPLSPPLPVTEEERARGVCWKLRILSEDSDEKTAMGAIADEFRKRPGVICGSGIHRVCAWGRDASVYAAKGYQHLLDVDGWALLLGVGFDRCSSMHLGERVPIPREIEERFKIPENVRRDYPDDICIGYEDPHAEPGGDEWEWGKVLREADSRGLVTRGHIGLAECMLFKVKPLVVIYEHYRRTEPFWLFGLDRP